MKRSMINQFLFARKITITSHICAILLLTPLTVQAVDWRTDWDRYLLEFRSTSAYNFLSKKTIMSESKDSLRFDGKVAIVTGAGGGM